MTDMTGVHPAQGMSVRGGALTVSPPQVANVVEMPLFVPAGWAYDSLGRRAVVLPALAALSVGWGILGSLGRQAQPLAGSSLRGMLLASSAMALGNGLLSGINSLTMQDMAPPPTSPHLANFVAIWNVLTSAGAISAPLIVGTLHERSSIYTAR
jgi:MFS family permease